MCSPAPRHALRPLHPRQPRHEERQQRHEQEASVCAEERVQARHLHRVRQEDQVWQGEVNVLQLNLVKLSILTIW